MENNVKSGTNSMFVSKCLLIAAAAILYVMQGAILIPAYRRDLYQQSLQGNGVSCSLLDILPGELLISDEQHSERQHCCINYAMPQRQVEPVADEH